MFRVVLILFAFLPSFLIAQTFGDKNAEWVYDYIGLGVDGITKIKQVRDTVIDSQTIKVFQRNFTRQNSSGEIFNGNLDPIYIKQKDGLIEFSEDLINFDTLYNFDLKIGQSWTVPERDFFTGEPTGVTLERIVLDTFTIILNEIPMLCQAVKSQFSSIDTIFQDIGSGLNYILPFDVNIADGEEGGILRCFKNDRVGVIDFQSTLMYRCPECLLSDFEYSCDQLNSFGETLISNSTFNLFPNPVSNTLHIQSQKEQITQVDIYNLNGQLILQEQADHVSKEIDVESLAPGMYYVLINEKYFEKVVVVE